MNYFLRGKAIAEVEESFRALFPPGDGRSGSRNLFPASGRLGRSGSDVVRDLSASSIQELPRRTLPDQAASNETTLPLDSEDAA